MKEFWKIGENLMILVYVALITTGSLVALGFTSPIVFIVSGIINFVILEKIRKSQ